MKTEITQYFRKKGGKNNGQPIGVFHARIVGDKFAVGFSLCNTRKDDNNIDFGIYLAEERARIARNHKVPSSMVKEFTKFFNRAEKYFKDKKFNGHTCINGGDPNLRIVELKYTDEA